LLTISATGCGVADRIFSPAPDNAEPYPPLPEYYVWWADLHRDVDHTGTPKPMPDQWYQVPGDHWVTRTSKEARGAWVNGRIYIASRHALCEAVVKHEMLHHYLGGDSAHAHPLFAKPLYSGVCHSDLK